MDFGLKSTLYLMKGMINLTEEQIEKAVNNAIIELGDDIDNQLGCMWDFYDKTFADNEIAKMKSAELSTMGTAIRISTMILKQALKELFCD